MKLIRRVTLALALLCGCGDPAAPADHRGDAALPDTRPMDAGPADMDTAPPGDAAMGDVPTDTAAQPDVPSPHDAAEDAPADIPPEDTDAPEDTGAAEDTGAPVEGPCPEPPFVAECVFGQTSQALRRSGAVEIREVATHTTDATMDELTGRQLVYGYQCEGIFAPASPAEAVALTDDGVYILEITVRASGERYTWLRLYMGDTEVGYIYQQGTLTLSARVSDQEIVACTVP